VSPLGYRDENTITPLGKQEGRRPAAVAPPPSLAAYFMPIACGRAGPVANAVLKSTTWNAASTDNPSSLTVNTRTV